MTQPICSACWALRLPDQAPRYRVQETAVRCAFCGTSTHAGLRTPADPVLVRFPEGVR